MTIDLLIYWLFVCLFGWLVVVDDDDDDDDNNDEDDDGLCLCGRTWSNANQYY